MKTENTFNATILTAIDNPLRKKFERNSNNDINVIQYQKAMWFKSESVFFDSIDTIWNVIKKISKYPRCCIIRGTNSNRINIRIRRLKENFHEEDGRPWVLFDVDNENLPDGINPLTVRGIEYFIQNRLPNAFHSVSYVYQFSSSAGIMNDDGTFKKPGLNVHLWFCFNRNVTNSELKEWLKNCSVDHALFNPVQVHYTAEPEVSKSLKCVLQKRQDFVIKDNNFVEVPDIEINNNVHKHSKIIPYKTNIRADNKRKQVLIDKLRKVDCIYHINDDSINIWHPGEKTKGGHFIFFNSPDIVHHHARNSMSIDRWLVKYWNYEIQENQEIIKPYYRHEKIYNAEEGKDVIRKLIQEFVENKVNMIIKAPPGIGKTEEGINVLQSGRVVHFLVPTHNLAEELHERIREIHPCLKGIVIKGRLQPGMCSEAETIIDGKSIVQILPDLGKTVFDHLCLRKTSDTADYFSCHNYLKCRYLKQFTEAENCNYVILTHDILMIKQKREYKLPKPDYLIIDESFWNKLVKINSIQFNFLMKYMEDDKTNNTEHEILKIILSSLIDKNSVIKSLNNNKITTNDVKLSMNKVKKCINRYCGIVPGMPIDMIKTAIKNTTNILPIYRLFKCLFEDFNNNREIEQQIRYNENKGEIELRYTIEPHKGYRDIPTLVIDADADLGIVSRLLNKDFLFHEVYVQRTSYVVQVKNKTFSTSSMAKIGNDRKHDKEVGQLIRDINNFLKLVSNKHKNGLVVCPKDLKIKFDIPIDWDVAHFGGFRGIDQYKNKECVIVIGRNEPRVPDVEAIASAIFHDDINPIECIKKNEKGEIRFLTEKRGYTLKDGTKQYGKVAYHPDPRCDKVLKQIRENESVQAISRIRDIWQDDKKVFLLSNLVVDFEIDRLIKWKDLKRRGTRIEQMPNDFNFDNEVLPFTSKYCSKAFSHLWENEEQFKKDRQRTLWEDKILYKLLIEKCPFLKVLRFKALDQKNWVKVITKYDSDKTLKMLTEQFGGQYGIHYSDITPWHIKAPVRFYIADREYETVVDRHGKILIKISYKKVLSSFGDPYLSEVRCPFCSAREDKDIYHYHGYGDGLRVPHCGENKNVFLKLKSGEVVTNNNDYILERTNFLTKTAN